MMMTEIRLRTTDFFNVEEILLPLLSKKAPPLNWNGLPMRRGQLTDTRGVDRKGRKKNPANYNSGTSFRFCLHEILPPTSPEPVLSIQFHKNCWVLTLSQGLGCLTEEVTDISTFYLRRALMTKTLVSTQSWLSRKPDLGLDLAQSPFNCECLGSVTSRISGSSSLNEWTSILRGHHKD